MSHSSALSGDAIDALLDGVDDAFSQVLHDRYGGSIELFVGSSGTGGAGQVLRANGDDNVLRLRWHQTGGPMPSPGHGIVVGEVKLTATGSIEDVVISAEIFDVHDVNEAADASVFGGGVLFIPMPDDLPGGAAAGGLGVVRSREAASGAAAHARQQQRGWLARQHRHNPNRALGLANNGNRRSPPSSIILPVSGDLLVRLAGAVAGAVKLGGDPKAGTVAVVVQTASADMA